MKFSAMSFEELRHCWQGRLLRISHGKMQAVILSMIAHSCNEEELLFLMKANLLSTYIPTPFFCSAAKISARGRIYCKMVDRHGEQVLTVVVFKHEKAMTGALRYLADRLYLSDTNRVEMFDMAKRWIVADYRYDPEHPEEKLRVVD